MKQRPPVPAPMDRGAVLQLALAMALSGSVGIFAVESAQPSTHVVFFRCLFGGCALAALSIATRQVRDFRHCSLRDLLFGLAGGLFLIINWVVLFEAFRHIPIGLTNIIYHLQPFWIVLFGGLFLRERMPLVCYFWVACAFAGLVLAIWPRIGDLRDDQVFALGIMLALISSLLYAGATLMIRAVRGIRPVALSTLHCLLGVVLIAPFLTPDAVPLPGSPAWPWLLGMGLVHTGLVYVMIYGAYPRLPTTAIAVLAFLNPAAALIGDRIWYGLPLNPWQVAGLGIILLSAFFISRGRVQSRNS